VADDREMLVALFEKSGAQVSAAASAREATEILERAIPDVVVCDVGLPDEDGHELMSRIRALGVEKASRVPAVALTA
jgi:CheY-like chemotaxis protein